MRLRREASSDTSGLRSLSAVMDWEPFASDPDTDEEALDCPNCRCCKSRGCLLKRPLEPPECSCGHPMGEGLVPRADCAEEPRQFLQGFKVDMDVRRELLDFTSRHGTPDEIPTGAVCSRSIQAYVLDHRFGGKQGEAVSDKHAELPARRPSIHFAVHLGPEKVKERK